METESLMINDIVQEWNNDHTETHIVTVEKPTREGVYDKFNHFHDADWIEPIPPTAEILQENDFSIEEGGSIMGLAIEDTFTMNIDDEQGQHKWAIIITDGPWCVKIKVFGMLAISIVIKSVHELQHALRLVGLNEMADNLKIE